MGETYNLAAELTLGNPSFHGSFKPKNTGKLSRIELYLQSLQEELKKIEAFKKELPLCMELLSNEIEASREQLCGCRQDEPCTQTAESLSHNLTPSTIPKMSSTIFCSQLNNMERSANQLLDLVHPNARPAETLSSNNGVEVDVDAARADEMVLAMANTLYRTKTIGHCSYAQAQVCSDEMLGMPTCSMDWPRLGGAFEPFLKKKWSNASEEAMETSTPPYDDHNGVASPGVENVDTNSSLGCEEAIIKLMQREEYDHATLSASARISGSPSQQRKPRRCWSSELHRKFVNALQQLGGAEVTTPKQIREHMQVEGLTNDEVKSHLQKYRLHTKKPNPMSLQQRTEAARGAHAGTAMAPTPQLVVLGGIWVPQEIALTQNQALTEPLYMQRHHVTHNYLQQAVQLLPP